MEDNLDCYDIEKFIYDSKLFNEYFIKGDYSIILIQDSHEEDIRFISLIKKSNCYNKYKFMAILDRKVDKELNLKYYSYCEIDLGCSYVFGCQMIMELIKNIKDLCVF